MNKSTKLIAAGLALPIALGLSVPANAAPRGHWDNGYEQNYRGDRSHHRGYSDPRIERRIDRLARDIRIAMRNGEIDRWQGRQVRERLRVVERSYAAFTRNGLSRRDVRTINWRIDQAYDALSEARYRSAHRGNDRYDRRYDRRGRY